MVQLEALCWLLLVASAFALFQRQRRARNSRYHSPKPIDDNENVSKPWQYPEPSPNLGFSLDQTPPPKYRAFRYSYTRHTIEVKKLDADSWVLLDNQFPRYHRAKIARLAERGDRIVKTLPSAQEAAKELCQDLSEFLSRRYPQLYKITRSKTDHNGWYNEGSIVRITIPAVEADYDLTREDPLTVAGLLQPADLNILLKAPNNEYILSGMMLGIGGGQRLKDKLGKSLADLHLGNVPHYAAQLQRPLDRFLSKLKVEAPIYRNTTAISIHDELHWPAITMGPEDDYDPIIHGPGVDTEGYKTFKPPKPITKIEQLFFRQERQTLRRLPKSGAIVWAVHTYIEPLAEVLGEAGIPGRLASLIRSWDDETGAHKGRHLYSDFLLPHLDQLHLQQIKEGLCEDANNP
ncbi:hypothetical protein B7463_g8239, partial [Scytalidium lignicola]